MPLSTEQLRGTQQQMSSKSLAMSEVMSRKSFFEGIDTTTIQKTTLNNKNEPVANGVSKSEQHSNNDRLLKKFNVFKNSDRNNLNLENNKNINTENHSSTMVEKVNDEQNESDSDFKYGPGFVTKLKCRYLSLTLRQSTINKQRPSLNQFLRRTTSLNNLLDEEEIVQGDIDDDEEEEGGGLKDNEENKNTNKNYNIINSGNNNNNNKVVHAFQENNQNKYSDTKGNGIDKCLLESYPPPADSHHHYHHHRIGRSNEKSDNRMNLKRARSVEAILRYDHSAWERDVEKEHIDNARDDEPHIYVKGPKDITIEDKIQSAKERNGDKKPKRLTSLIDEDERPPHEIVKQTLRIFEASANRKRNPQTRPIGNEIAGKVATFKSKMGGQQEHNKQTAVLQLKKPNIIPRTTSPIVTSNSNNLNQINNTKNFNHCTNNNEKYAKFTKEKATLPKLDINIIKNNLESKSNGGSNNHQHIHDELEMGYRNHKLDYSSANSDSSISTPNILSPFRNSMSPQLFDTNQQQQQQQHEQKPALLKKPTASSFEPSSPMISFLSSKLNNLHVESSTPKTYSKSSNLLKSDDKETSSVDNELEDALNSSPILSRNDNKNIHTYNNSQNMSEVTSNESNDSFSADIDGDSDVKCANETVVDGAAPPKTINIIQKINNITNNGNNNNNNISSSNNNNNVMKVTHEKISAENNNEVKSFVMKSSPPLPPTKMRELEKNLINNEKNGNSVNQEEQSSQSGLASALPKWTVKKKTWSQQPEQDNTIVFNFSDRKDVPDYIEHDGIILRRKRELPKPHESGFVLLGDLTLDSSTDNDDAYQMGPPSPCDVEFENANIIIDGKSSIRTKAKEVKFKIQFDDSLTRTFEYASETSLLVDDGTEEEDEVDGNFYKNGGNGAQSKLLTSVPLGGAPFANYTSVKTSGAGFELGVTRPSSAPSEEFTQPINNTFDDPEYLKPATDDETVVWSSEGTRATDLLF